MDLGKMINVCMMEELRKKMDIAEVYSPLRIVEMAKRMGLKGGWSPDLTTCDEDGRAWDFNQPEMRNRAARKFIKDKPRLLIGSPICTPFSQINNINHARMAPEEVNQRLDHGRTHLGFCMKFYDIQWREGRYFVHEHPQAAKSWEEECVPKLLAKNDVQRVIGDKCMYGLKSEKGGRIGPARKSIGFMTNSPCIAQALSPRCPNLKGKEVHEHVRLEGGRTKAAQVYPPGLCRAICQGYMKQIEADRKGQFRLAELSSSDGGKEENCRKPP